MPATLTRAQWAPLHSKLRETSEFPVARLLLVYGTARIERCVSVLVTWRIEVPPDERLICSQYAPAGITVPDARKEKGTSALIVCAWAKPAATTRAAAANIVFFVKFFI